MKEPSKLAVAGDWHGDLRFARNQVMSLAYRNIDTILHSGDFGVYNDPLYLDSLNVVLKKSGIVLYFVDGNHEDHTLLLSYDIAEDGTRPIRSNIIHLPRGFRWEWRGKTYLALGGAYSIDREWNTWWAEEEIGYADFENSIDGGRVDVMITHDCPSEVDIPAIRTNPMNLPERILRAAENHRSTLWGVVQEVKPQVLFHGHYHCRYESIFRGKDFQTKIVGLDMNRRPWYDNVVTVDLDTLEVFDGKLLEV